MRDAVRADMSQASTDAALTEKQRRIRRYLLDRADSKTYFKSRLIGDDLGLSPKEVGANISALAEQESELRIEPWGYSSSTTWKVSA